MLTSTSPAPCSQGTSTDALLHIRDAEQLKFLLDAAAAYNLSAEGLKHISIQATSEWVAGGASGNSCSAWGSAVWGCEPACAGLMCGRRACACLCRCVRMSGLAAAALPSDS